MKKREITDNDLELIFNNIIKQTPLITEDQVIVFLNQLPKAPPSNLRHFLKTHLNVLIIGTVILSVVTVAFFLTNTERKTDKTFARNAIQKSETNLIPNDSVAIKSLTVVPNSANEKIAAKPALADSNSVTAKVPKLSVSGIYKRFEKKPQIFSIRADRDTVIVCREKTAISIKANSFVSEKTGETITGKVKLAVKEYYKMSDILLARLSTTSDGKIIETGGMLHISATSGNENCGMKQGEKLEIGFPYSKKKEGMITFSGEWKNDQINWKPFENSAPTSSDEQVMTSPETQSKLMLSDNGIDPVFVVVEEMPEFPGGTTNLRRYIDENKRYPYSAVKDKLQGRVYVNFVVDPLGSITNIHVVRSQGNVLDKAAAYLVSRMPAWKPGKQRGKPVPVSYTIPISFLIKDSDLTAEGIRQAKLFEEKLKDLKYNMATQRLANNKTNSDEEFEKEVVDGNLHETDIFAANRYVLGAYQLGWINCDLFENFLSPKTDFSVLLDEPREAIVSVIFHRFKAIIPGKTGPDRLSFKDVPVGEKITIVALKTAKDKILLAVKEAVISDKIEVNLDFQPITIDLLKAEMEKLNQLY